MAEMYGNRTHPGLYQPHDGFEDRENHQTLNTSPNLAEIPFYIDAMNGAFE